jgi:hypothetical protein
MRRRHWSGMIILATVAAVVAIWSVQLISSASSSSSTQRTLLAHDAILSLLYSTAGDDNKEATTATATATAAMSSSRRGNLNVSVLEAIDTVQLPTHDQLPLHIGAGWGTTGTPRSMHNACCKLGIPSLHWDKYCPPPPSSNNNNNINSTSLNNNIERNIQLQQEILNTTIALWEQYPGKTKQEHLALYRRLQQQVASIVQNTNVVVAAIHDVPYVQLLPFIVKVAKQANRRVIVLYSTRNASEWVASRA